MNGISGDGYGKVKCAGPRIRWRLTRSPLHYVITTDIRRMDLAQWRSMSENGSPFLDPAYLDTLNKTTGPAERFRYVLFFQGKAPVGIAVFHLTRFEAKGLPSPMQEGVLGRMLSQSLRSKGQNMDVLICGNAFATGEHGFRFVPHLPHGQAMDALCYALTDVLNKERKDGWRISAVVAKDFYDASRSYASALEKCGFRSFEVDHTMILPIPAIWQNLDDYLEAMNAKFRTKAHAALRKSATLVVKDLDEHEAQSHRQSLQRLYEEVAGRADFRLGRMSGETFVELKQTFGSRMILRAYFAGDEMVGFLSGILQGDQMEAHMVGIDYSVNKEYALYSRMLYDYIDLAIRNRSRWVIFGRTASEIKSSVGAFPVSLQCAIRHPGRVSNLWMNLFFACVGPSGFAQRNPWKKEVFATLSEQMNEWPAGYQPAHMPPALPIIA